MKNLYAYLTENGHFHAVPDKEIATKNANRNIRILPITVRDDEYKNGYITKDGKEVILDVIMHQEKDKGEIGTIEDLYLDKKTPENVMEAKDLPEIMKNCLSTWGVKY